MRCILVSTNSEKYNDSKGSVFVPSVYSYNDQLKHQTLGKCRPVPNVRLMNDHMLYINTFM